MNYRFVFDVQVCYIFFLKQRFNIRIDQVFERPINEMIF